MPDAEWSSRLEAGPGPSKAAVAGHLRAVAESLPLIAWTAGPDGSDDYFNRYWYEYTGLTPAACEGLGWMAAIHPDDLPEARRRWHEAREAGAGFEVEHRLRLADGSSRRFLTRAEPLLDDEGRALQWFGTCAEAGDATAAGVRTTERDGRPYPLIVAPRVHDLAALREERERLRFALASARMFAWEWDLASAAGTAVGDVEAVLGAPAPALADFLARLHPDDRPGFEAAMARAATGGGDTEHEARAVRPDGGVTWLAIKARPRPGPDGRPTHLTGVAIDVTGRKRAEERLRDSEARLGRLAESDLIGINFANIRGGISRANDAYLRIIGYTREEFESGPAGWRGVTPPDWIHADERAIAEAKRRGSCTPFEKQYVRKDGSRVWVLVGFTLLGEERDEAVAFILDLTELKRAEAARHEVEQRLALAVDAARLGTWDFDPASGRMVWDDRCRALFGLPPGAEVDYATFLDGLHPDDRGRVDAIAAAALDPGSPTGGTYRAEYRTVGLADGVERWVSACGRAFFEGGRAVRFIGTVFDVTELKRVEEALREADRRKDEFLATLGHELRNPLSAICHAAALARRDGADAETVAWGLDVVDHQCSQLSRLVDDLLDVSRIARGKVALRRQRIDAASVAAAAAGAVRPLVEEKGQALAVECGPGPLVVDADPARVEQILVNLLTNASKYTDAGGRIALRVRREGESIAFRVRDTGIGLAPEMLPRVFELFAQAEGSLGRSRGGLGIGLTLVRTLAEMHGGSASAHSDGPGRGSEFVVILPAVEGPAVEPAGAAGGQATAAPARAPRRVLVVDDNADTARTMSRLLSLSGHEVRVALDGDAALAEADAWGPDVVLLDIGLPGRDGYQVAEALRSRPALAGTALVAVTGYGQDSDRRRSAGSGFDHHLVKPVDFREVLALVEGPGPTDG